MKAPALGTTPLTLMLSIMRNNYLLLTLSIFFRKWWIIYEKEHVGLLLRVQWGSSSVWTQTSPGSFLRETVTTEISVRSCQEWPGSLSTVSRRLAPRQRNGGKKASKHKLKTKSSAEKIWGFFFFLYLEEKKINTFSSIGGVGMLCLDRLLWMTIRGGEMNRTRNVWWAQQERGQEGSS